MAIPGIGLQSIIQFPPRNTNQRALTDVPSKNESQSGVLPSTAESVELKSTLFTAISQPSKSDEATNSRRNLVETVRNRFQLQNETLNRQGGPAQAVQSFLDVANFERKDELTSLVGIDIFI